MLVNKGGNDKIRLYALTEAGKIVARRESGDGDEVAVLKYMRNNKSKATDDELEIVGEKYVIRQLKERGLIKELTT